jgi:hypothetical protein
MRLPARPVVRYRVCNSRSATVSTGRRPRRRATGGTSMGIIGTIIAIVIVILILQAIF